MLYKQIGFIMRIKHLLVSTCAFVCISIVSGMSTANADASTSAEIALLKAELRRLEAKVDEQEQRSKAIKQTSAAKPGAQVTAAKAVGNQVYGDGPLPTFVACPEKVLCYKGLTFTPGGFLALESVTRSRNLASDVDTPYGAIPFRQNRAGRTGRVPLLRPAEPYLRPGRG